MAIDYPALAQVAVDLITDNGREIQLLVAATSPAATPWVPGAESPRTLQAVETDPDDADRGDDPGVNALRREYIVASDGGATPLPGQRIQDGSEVLSITAVQQIRPADVVMYWNVRASG